MIKNIIDRIVVIVGRARSFSKRMLKRWQLKLLERSRENASTLSRVLCHDLGADCHCRIGRTAVLRLDNILETARTGAASEDRVKFMLVLKNNKGIFSKSRKKEQHQWDWAEMEVEVLDDGDPDSYSVVLQKPDTPDSTSGSASHRPGFVQKSVSFAAGFLRSNPETLEEPSSPESLCLVISSAAQPDASRPKVLGNENIGEIGLLMRPHDYGSWRKLVSLQQLLVKTGSLLKDLPMPRKLQLALTASASMLHLYRTNWLKHSWTSSDIFFVQSQNGSIMDDAFVAQGLHDGSRGDVDAAGLEIFNPSLFAFGIFLTELSFNRPWERLRKREVPGLDFKEFADKDHEMMVDLAVVNAIFHNARNENIPVRERPFHNEGPWYLQAAQNCFASEMNISTEKPTDSFVGAIYSKIVQPLEYAVQDQVRRRPIQEEKHTMSKSRHLAQVSLTLSLFDDKVAKNYTGPDA
jgi:hypothetical protein